MKITVDKEKSVFKPITIQLETAQEYFELIAALGESTGADIERGMNSAQVGHLYKAYDDVVGRIYNKLADMVDEVKETL